MTVSHFIPDEILIHSDFWDEGNETLPSHSEILVGKVQAILRDSLGDQYCVFEMADMAGLFIIHLGSNFFKGFTTYQGDPT